VVLDLIVISRVPSNPTPLINLMLSSAVAVDALPLRLPLTKTLEFNVMPASSVLKPAIELLVLMVNGLDETIPITMSETVIRITGYSVPVSAKSVVLLALVSPKPSAVSGPMNTQLDPFHVWSVFAPLLNQKAPTGGFSGGLVIWLLIQLQPTCLHHRP